jgi:lipopolysaccharide/colanic/teichoic acid biosynthesis glycosyltransferase
MKNENVRYYFDILDGKRLSLVTKRIFDVVVSVILLILLSPLFFVISFAIVIDSRGAFFFRQERVTQYGRRFLIFKFRTMVTNAEQIGTQVTVKGDKRITRVGNLLRKYHIDEIPQLINVLTGDMSFVGTRPEVVRYVEAYNEDMLASLLLPAGITSKASVKYKDENQLLHDSDNIEKVYVGEVLPQKMKYNLEYIEQFSFFNDIKLLAVTFLEVLKKD